MDSLRENGQTDNDIQSNKGLIFASKFKSIPLIISTCFWLSENYCKLKQANFITKTTCDLAETTLKSSYSLATPILSKFINQVGFVDALASNQLDRLIASFTLLSNDTNSLFNHTKDFINFLKVQPKDKTRSFINKMLDMSENFIESNLIYEELFKDNSSEDKLSKNNLELLKLFKNQKELSKNDLSHRTKVLTLVAYNSIQFKLLNQLNESFKLFKAYLLNLFKIIETFKSAKEALAESVKDKFHVTKDKIDVYKEYLDVLSKQFTVQDGRSLDHIHSMEERTKIIIRRSIGNLLTAFHIIHSRIKHFDPIIQQKFNTIRHFLLSLYTIYDKTNANDGVVNSAVNESASHLDWFVPNFGAFCVLDEEDDFDEGDMVQFNYRNQHDLDRDRDLSSIDSINNQNKHLLNELTHHNHRLI